MSLILSRSFQGYSSSNLKPFSAEKLPVCSRSRWRRASLHPHPLVFRHLSSLFPVLPAVMPNLLPLELLPDEVRWRVDSYVVSPSKPNAVWIDLLPDKVCVQIAFFVSRGKQTISALNLASVSNTQSYAVWASLDNPVCISQVEEPPRVRGHLGAFRKPFASNDIQTEDDAKRWARVSKTVSSRLLATS